MELAKLILQYLQVLCWPTVATLSLFMFRHELRALVGRVRTAKFPGGVSIDFPEEIREAKRLSERVEALPSRRPATSSSPTIPLTGANSRMIELGLRPSPSGLDMNYYRALAEQDPNVALAGLRIEVDVLARNLARGFGVEVSDRDSGWRLVRRLYEQDAITIEQMHLIQKVLDLCNAAVHGTPVSSAQAEAVLTLADVLAEQYLDWLSWGFDDGWRPSNSPENEETANQALQTAHAPRGG